MKVMLTPMGTTGDIRPFIALGLSLRKLGNQVMMVIPRNAEDLCKKFKFPYQLTDFDYKELVDIIDKKPSMKEMIDVLDREIASPFKILKETAMEADFIIGSARNYALQPIAELYNLPYYQVWHTPQVFKSLYMTPWRFSHQDNPAWLNFIYWKIHNMKENRIGERFVNKHRESLGLTKIKDFTALHREKILYVGDAVLGPVPSDVKAEYLQTDYWHLYDEEDLPVQITDFIHAGDKPLFFSFGSAPDKDGEKTVEMVEGIVHELGIRAIIQKGWAGLESRAGSKKVMVIGGVSHHRLFPLVGAAVHHGGAGTTHTAALAGIPQIVVPQFGDQLYWGSRVNHLELGPTPIRKPKLNKENLKQAIQQALEDRGIQENTKKVAQVLKQRESMDRIAVRLHSLMLSKVDARS